MELRNWDAKLAKKMRNCYFPPSLPGWFVAVGMVVVAHDAPVDCGLVAAIKFLK